MGITRPQSTISATPADAPEAAATIARDTGAAALLLASVIAPKLQPRIDPVSGAGPIPSALVDQWLSHPFSKEDAVAALKQGNGGAGSFCFRDGSAGKVLCVQLTNAKDIGHFRIRQVGCNALGLEGG